MYQRGRHHTAPTDSVHRVVVALGGFKEQGASVLRTGATKWEAGVLPDLYGTVEEISYYGICSVMLAEDRLVN